METIAELMDRLARLDTLPAREKVAEQVLLFRRVVDVLRGFVDRETALLPAIRRLKPLTRELSARLRDIEAAGPNGPDETLVQAYYRSLLLVQAAVREIEKQATPIPCRSLRDECN